MSASFPPVSINVSWCLIFNSLLKIITEYGNVPTGNATLEPSNKSAFTLGCIITSLPEVFVKKFVQDVKSGSAPVSPVPETYGFRDR